MSKIAIISRPDQGVLIDVTGCTTMQEAIEHMSSTLQVGSQFWKGLAIDLNLGRLKLSSEQVNQLLAIAKGLGVVPKEVFSEDEQTIAALQLRGVTIGRGRPMMLAPGSEVNTSEAEQEAPRGETEVEEEDGPAEIDTTGRRIIMYEGDDALSIAGEIDSKPKESETASDDGEALAKKTEAPDSVMYLKQTLRSGQAVSHKGHLVIIGDVNAGAEVVAEGDITIWGCLRGVAHAGLGGNTQAEIRALKLQPIQIRIADSIARSPDPPKAGQSTGWGPESARLVNGKIRILRNALD
jgi:septum site-determining protein MinC